MSRGSLVVHNHVSELLEGNPLGDRTERPITVYLPPDHDPAVAYPTLYAIVGYTGSGPMLFNLDPLGEDLKSKLDRLMSTGAMPPAIIVAPDCFTRVGGNQYINSSATGPYEDYLIKEIIPFVEEQYTCGKRGIWGKSSGGYGSIVQGLRNPDVFAGLACHSGDMGFELCYLPDFPKALEAIREAGGVAPWLKAYWEGDNRRKNVDFPALNAIGMSAHYSPNPDNPDLGLDLPFDWRTGAFRPRVWERWKANDPINMLETLGDNLRKLDLVYVDCGTKDQFNLIWGARALHDRMEQLGIEHVYEEFDDTHSNLSYRYDVSLPLLAKRLSA